MQLTRRVRPATVGVTAAVVAAVLVAGCGGGSTSANTQSQQDVQAQIERARKDAARQARLEERVKQLEADKRQADRVRTVTETVVVAPGEPPAPAPEVSPASSGYIAQLGSFTTESAAQAKAAQLRDRGLSPLVLESSRYAQLRPGYWVVYEGFFSTLAQARAAADHAKSVGVTDAFARAVSPS